MNRWANLNRVELDISRPRQPTSNAFIEEFNARFLRECPTGNEFLTRSTPRRTWYPHGHFRSGKTSQSVEEPDPQRVCRIG